MKGVLSPTKSVSATFKSEAYPLPAQYSQVPHSIVQSTSVCQTSTVVEGSHCILGGNERERSLPFAPQELVYSLGKASPNGTETVH